MASQQRQSREVDYGTDEGYDQYLSQSRGKSSIRLPEGVELFTLKGISNKVLLNILPYRVGKGHPTHKEGKVFYARPVYVHRNVGIDGKTVVCPRETAGKPCPICEDFSRRRRSNEDWETLKNAKAQLRVLMNVEAPEIAPRKVMVFDTAHNKSFGELLQATKELTPSNENFWHLEGGKTLACKVSDDNFGGQSFKKVSAIQMIDRPDYPAKVLDKTVCLDDCIALLDYDDIKKMYFEEVGGGDDDVDGGTGKPSSTGWDDDENDTKAKAGKGKKPEKVEKDDGWGDDKPTGKPEKEEEPEIEAGDKVTFEYKGKTKTGTVEKISKAKKLALVDCGDDKPAAVSLSDLTKVVEEEEKPKKGGKKAEKEKEDDGGWDDDDATPPFDKGKEAKGKPGKKDDDWD